MRQAVLRSVFFGSGPSERMSGKASTTPRTPEASPRVLTRKLRRSTATLPRLAKSSTKASRSTRRRLEAVTGLRERAPGHQVLAPHHQPVAETAKPTAKVSAEPEVRLVLPVGSPEAGKARGRRAGNRRRRRSRPGAGSSRRPGTAARRARPSADRDRHPAGLVAGSCRHSVAARRPQACAELSVTGLCRRGRRPVEAVVTLVALVPSSSSVSVRSPTQNAASMQAPTPTNRPDEALRHRADAAEGEPPGAGRVLDVLDDIADDVDDLRWGDASRARSAACCPGRSGSPPRPSSW